MAVAIIIVALALFYLLAFYKGENILGKNKVADFIKAFSEIIPSDCHVERSSANGNVVLKCSCDDLKVDINFIQTDAGVEGVGMAGVWISISCSFKTKRTFKISKSKKRLVQSALVSEFDGRYQIEADCEETRMRIVSNPNLCEPAKKILELFNDVDLSDEILSVTSDGVNFRRSEPKALLSHLDSFIAFARDLKTNSYFL